MSYVHMYILNYKIKYFLISKIIKKNPIFKKKSIQKFVMLFLQLFVNF